MIVNTTFTSSIREQLFRMDKSAKFFQIQYISWACYHVRFTRKSFERILEQVDIETLLEIALHSKSSLSTDETWLSELSKQKQSKNFVLRSISTMYEKQYDQYVQIIVTLNDELSKRAKTYDYPRNNIDRMNIFITFIKATERSLPTMEFYFPYLLPWLRLLFPDFRCEQSSIKLVKHAEKLWKSTNSKRQEWMALCTSKRKQLPFYKDYLDIEESKLNQEYRSCFEYSFEETYFTKPTNSNPIVPVEQKEEVIDIETSPNEEVTEQKISTTGNTNSANLHAALEYHLYHEKKGLRTDIMNDFARWIEDAKYEENLNPTKRQLVELQRNEKEESILESTSIENPEKMIIKRSMKLKTFEMMSDPRKRWTSHLSDQKFRQQVEEIPIDIGDSLILSLWHQNTMQQAYWVGFIMTYFRCCDYGDAFFPFELKWKSSEHALLLDPRLIDFPILKSVWNISSKMEDCYRFESITSLKDHEKEQFLFQYGWFLLQCYTLGIDPGVLNVENMVLSYRWTKPRIHQYELGDQSVICKLKESISFFFPAISKMEALYSRGILFPTRWNRPDEVEKDKAVFAKSYSYWIKTVLVSHSEELVQVLMCRWKDVNQHAAFKKFLLGDQEGNDLQKVVLRVVNLCAVSEIASFDVISHLRVEEILSKQQETGNK